MAGQTVVMEGAGADETTQHEDSDLQHIGHFTVLHEIAEGGMGVVYAAHDEQLGRKVAIKLLHARGDHGDQAHDRMIREARAMARLSHPNVVQVHEVGTFDGKTFVASVDAYNTEMLRLESGLGTIMVLAFWILDWMFAPEHIVLALLIRLGIGGAALSVHMLCRRRPRLVERHIDDPSLAIDIRTGWGMSAIIWLTGGYESGYHAGLNLLVLSLGIMFLWTVRRALLLNGIVYVFYMASRKRPARERCSTR